MHKHHEDSIGKLISLYKEQPGVLGVILGGSVAKGTERPDSDIDAMVVLDEAAYAQRVQNGSTVEVIHGHTPYEGGYFDVKYMDMHFLRMAAKQGSEPTRNAFVKARVLWAVENQIETLAALIGRYPAEEKQDKILSFLGYLALDSGYFWREAERAGDLFLTVKTAGSIVHFGLRLILAHNEILFPCARGLMKAVETAALKPEGITDLAQAFLTRLDTPSKDAFVAAVLGFTDWGVSLEKDFGRVLSRYTDNNEQWWLNPRPLVAEW